MTNDIFKELFAVQKSNECNMEGIDCISFHSSTFASFFRKEQKDILRFWQKNYTKLEKEIELEKLLVFNGGKTYKHFSESIQEENIPFGHYVSAHNSLLEKLRISEDENPFKISWGGQIWDDKSWKEQIWPSQEITWSDPLGKIKNHEDFVEYIINMSGDTLSQQDIADFRSGKLGYSDVDWEQEQCEYLIDAVTVFNIMKPSLALELFPSLYLNGLLTKADLEVHLLETMSVEEDFIEFKQILESGKHNVGEVYSMENTENNTFKVVLNTKTKILLSDDETKYFQPQITLEYDDSHVESISNITYIDQDENIVLESTLHQMVEEIKVPTKGISIT